MKAVEKAAFAATYKTVWVAGASIEFAQKIEPVQAIIERIISEYQKAFDHLCKTNHHQS
jgi:nitronate monooxygenase